MGSYEFKFPDVGEGIHEGTIVKWLVKKGDVVKQDQILAEVETDKAVVEIPSPKSGKITKLNATEGQVIKVGDTMVVFEVEGETTQEIATKKEVTPEKAGGVVGMIPESEEDLGGNVSTSLKKAVPAKKTVSKTSSSSVKATPALRKLAKELGVDLSTVKGTGSNGRITAVDLKHAMGTSTKDPEKKTESKTVEARKQEQKKKAKHVRKYDMWGYVDHVPLKGMRKAIADHMDKSWTAPLVTHTDEADVTELVLLRAKEKVKAKKKGVHLTYLPYIIKAVIKAFEKYPMLNAALDRENDDIIVKKYFNIGIAVDTGEGLVVPVVKGADKKDLYTIAKDIENLATKAKNKKLDLMDMKGGTFTITNVGGLGGIYFTPLLNSPEVAILGIGKLMDKPVVRNEKIVVRKVLPFSLSFDHRVVDGAQAARFMTELIEILDCPKHLK